MHFSFCRICKMNHVVSSFLLFSLANTDFYEQNKILVVDILSAPGLRLSFRSASGSQRLLLLEFSPEATSSSVAVATPPSPLATIPAATSARHGFFRQGFDAWDVLSPVSFGTKNSTCHPRSSFRMLMRPSLACRASFLLGYVRRDRLLLV